MIYICIFQSSVDKLQDLIGFARPEKDGDFNVIVSSSYVAVNSSDEPSLTLGSIGVNESMLIAVDWTQKTKTKKGCRIVFSNWYFDVLMF